MSKIKAHPTAQLLVEGNDDLHVILSLCKQFGIDVRNLENPKTGRFSIEDCKGVEKLLEQISIRLWDLDILGIVLDADSDIQSRWQSLKDIFQKSGFKFPKEIPENGLILEEKGKKIGIWIMPNNQINGMLEDFVKFLIPESDPLLPKAEKILVEIENEKLNKYSEIHKPKALIHTWLAWQQEAGKPMGVAITARYLTTENKELCQKFITWIQQLFN